MARKRRIQLEKMMEKKQIGFQSIVEKQSERNYRENIIRLKYSQDSNFQAVEKYIRKIIHSEDPFMVKKRKKFENGIRVQMKRQQFIDILKKEDKFIDKAKMRQMKTERSIYNWRRLVLAILGEEDDMPRLTKKVLLKRQKVLGMFTEDQIKAMNEPKLDELMTEKLEKRRKKLLNSAKKVARVNRMQVGSSSSSSISSGPKEPDPITPFSSA